MDEVTAYLVGNRDRKVAELEAEIGRLRTDNGQLRSALRDARDALYNPFEPDNQSLAYKRADEALN